MQVVFEDNHLLVVIKPSGQTVQPEPGKPLSLEEQAKAYLKTKYNKPGEVFLGVAHRLDMPVAGLVVFARTSKALTRLNEQFQKREITKIYQAWVVNFKPFKSGDSQKQRLVHWLKRDEKKNFTKAFLNQVNGALEASLSISEIGKEGKFTLLKIELHTGRKHQIRAQLSAEGFPIVGDGKYGARHLLKMELLLYKLQNWVLNTPFLKKN